MNRTDRTLRRQGVVLLGVIMLVWSLAGCSGTSAGAAAETTTRAESAAGAAASAAAPAENVAASADSAEEIWTMLTGSMNLPGVVRMPAQYVLNYYGIDMEQYPDSFFAVSEEATSAETVIFIRTGSEEEANALGEQLNVVREQKAEEMQNYLPEQYRIVEASRVRVKGDSVYLVISEQEEAIRTLIEAAL